MDVIKKYVDEKYYTFYETEENPESIVSAAVPAISDLLRSTNIQESVDISQLPAVLSILNASQSGSTSIQASSNSLTTGPSNSVAPSVVSSVIVSRTIF